MAAEFMMGVNYILKYIKKVKSFEIIFYSITVFT